MHIVIPGGNGQIGRILARAAQVRGHHVTILSRRPMQGPWDHVAWDGRTLGPWTSVIDGADVVINLAGRSVDCRYTPANRQEILTSRVDSTRVIGAAIAQAARPPRAWLQAGTATIYSHRYDAAQDEAHGILGGNEPHAPDTWRFSIEVAQAWEAATKAVNLPQTRTVILRSAMVMSPDHGGVFDVILRLVRWGLGGPWGNGRQFMSWIHDQDFLRAVFYLIESSDLAGPVNLAAPTPLPQAEFMRALRTAWGIRLGLPAPGPLLELGALILRTETELTLKSRRVVPQRLQDSGFTFDHPTWPEAAAELCQRWRQGHP